MCLPPLHRTRDGVVPLLSVLLKGLRSHDLEYIDIALAKTAKVFVVSLDEKLAAAWLLSDNAC
jgi:hypothetical protein